MRVAVAPRVHSVTGLLTSGWLRKSLVATRILPRSKGSSAVGRPSSIIGTAIHDKVDAMLDAGETLLAIRAVTGASLASLSRYSNFRKSHLARVIDEEPNVFDLVARLLATADDARAARQQAQGAGSPAARARAIRTEAELIGKLLDALGVDDARLAEQMEQAHALAVAVRDHVLEDADPADLIPRLRSIPGLADVAVALERRMEKTR